MCCPEGVGLPLSQKGLLSTSPRPELVLRRCWLGYVKRSSKTDCIYGDDRSKARLSGSNTVAQGQAASVFNYFVPIRTSWMTVSFGPKTSHFLSGKTCPITVACRYAVKAGIE